MRRQGAWRETRLFGIMRQIRITRGLTQSTVASAVGVTTNYIYMIEAALRLPSLKLSMGICTFLGLSPGWIETRWMDEQRRRFDDKLRGGQLQREGGDEEWQSATSEA